MSSFWQILTFKILTLNLGRWLPHLRFFSFWARILQDKGMQLLLPHTLRLVTTAFIWVPTAVRNIQKSKQAVSACCLHLYLEVGRGEQGRAEQLLCPSLISMRSSEILGCRSREAATALSHAIACWPCEWLRGSQASAELHFLFPRPLAWVDTHLVGLKENRKERAREAVIFSPFGLPRFSK